jgi:hypothetical protein
LLVVETARDKPADDRPCCLPAIERKVSDAPFDAVVGEPPVDALDDVAALAQRPHHLLCLLRQAPSCRTERHGKAKVLEFLHAADHGGASMPVRSGVGAGPKVCDAIMLASIARERAIEFGPTIGFDLGLEIAPDFEVASWPELEGGKMRSTGAQAVADVVAGNHEVAAVVALAADDDMDVRVVRIPVIDPNPIEPGAEILFGLHHQVSGERPQIRKLLRVLRGHDEPEMMPISFAAVGERAIVGIVVLGVEHPAGGAVLRDTLPPQVG